MSKIFGEDFSMLEAQPGSKPDECYRGEFLSPARPKSRPPGTGNFGAPSKVNLDDFDLGGDDVFSRFDVFDFDAPSPSPRKAAPKRVAPEFSEGGTSTNHGSCDPNADDSVTITIDTTGKCATRLAFDLDDTTKGLEHLKSVNILPLRPSHAEASCTGNADEPVVQGAATHGAAVKHGSSAVSTNSKDSPPGIDDTAVLAQAPERMPTGSVMNTTLGPSNGKGEETLGDVQSSDEIEDKEAHAGRADACGVAAVAGQDVMEDATVTHASGLIASVLPPTNNDQSSFDNTELPAVEDEGNIISVNRPQVDKDTVVGPEGGCGGQPAGDAMDVIIQGADSLCAPPRRLDPAVRDAHTQVLQTGDTQAKEQDNEPRTLEKRGVQTSNRVQPTLKTALPVQKPLLKPLFARKGPQGGLSAIRPSLHKSPKVAAPLRDQSAGQHETASIEASQALSAKVSRAGLLHPQLAPQKPLLLDQPRVLQSQSPVLQKPKQMQVQQQPRLQQDFLDEQMALTERTQVPALRTQDQQGRKEDKGLGRQRTAKPQPTMNVRNGAGITAQEEERHRAQHERSAAREAQKSSQQQPPQDMHPPALQPLSHVPSVHDQGLMHRTVFPSEQQKPSDMDPVRSGGHAYASIQSRGALLEDYTTAARQKAAADSKIANNDATLNTLSDSLHKLQEGLAAAMEEANDLHVRAAMYRADWLLLERESNIRAFAALEKKLAIVADGSSLAMKRQAENTVALRKRRSLEVTALVPRDAPHTVSQVDANSVKRLFSRLTKDEFDSVLSRWNIPVLKGEPKSNCVARVLRSCLKCGLSESQLADLDFTYFQPRSAQKTWTVVHLVSKQGAPLDPCMDEQRVAARVDRCLGTYFAQHTAARASPEEMWLRVHVRSTAVLPRGGAASPGDAVFLVLRAGTPCVLLSAHRQELTPFLYRALAAALDCDVRQSALAGRHVGSLFQLVRERGLPHRALGERTITNAADLAQGGHPLDTSLSRRQRKAAAAATAEEGAHATPSDGESVAEGGAEEGPPQLQALQFLVRDEYRYSAAAAPVQDGAGTEACGLDTSGPAMPVIETAIVPFVAPACFTYHIKLEGDHVMAGLSSLVQGGLAHDPLPQHIAMVYKEVTNCIVLGFPNTS
eukprot:jgi/Mesvir1/17419/Mv08703-RA.1